MDEQLLTELTIDCKNSPQCAPAKHHFDECVERVHQQESEGGAKEDCVEECEYHPIRHSTHRTTHAVSSNESKERITDGI